MRADKILVFPVRRLPLTTPSVDSVGPHSRNGIRRRPHRSFSFLLLGSERFYVRGDIHRTWGLCWELRRVVGLVTVKAVREKTHD